MNTNVTVEQKFLIYHKHRGKFIGFDRDAYTSSHRYPGMGDHWFDLAELELLLAKRRLTHDPHSGRAPEAGILWDNAEDALRQFTLEGDGDKHKVRNPIQREELEVFAYHRTVTTSVALAGNFPAVPVMRMNDANSATPGPWGSA
jgi:hypothetical protein